MESMSPGARMYFSSLGVTHDQEQGQHQGQSQIQVHPGHDPLKDVGQGQLTPVEKSKMMRDGKEACMKRTKTSSKMMTEMFTPEQMDSVCGSEMNWRMKAEEARR